MGLRGGAEVGAGVVTEGVVTEGVVEEGAVEVMKEGEEAAAAVAMTKNQKSLHPLAVRLQSANPRGGVVFELASFSVQGG